MKIDTLLEDLASDDPTGVDAALRQLADRPDSSVPALLRGAAAAQGRKAALRPFLTALRHIGPAAFDEVMAAAQRGEIRGWLAHELLGAFDERCADRYATLASVEDYGKSGVGFRALLRLRTDSEAGVQALVTGFSRGGPVPYEASRYARALHEEFRPRLRALRRDPAVPARIRRGAMAALVAGGGTDALDGRDRALLTRLIGVKITDETPRLPETTLSGWWMAVPGATYEGVFPALGLHDPRPVTTAGGLDASEGQEIEVTGPAGEEIVVGRVFVTPELDGWRLVFGSSDRLIGDDPWDGMIDAVERASSHCGHAQLFFLDDAGGSDVWFVAENGRVIRRFAADSEPEWEGDPLPWETLATDGSGSGDDDVPSDAGTAGTVGAREACAHLSVDPGEVGPGTRVVGHGWLAITAPDVGHRAFPGTIRL
ncbi:hypothetical protein [Streptomyces yangpuensis]|uniref:hypothetical protein n=1 Tax=Streptomyces yangpuensis TaxID=1648182 RepID=UPI0036613DB2